VLVGDASYHEFLAGKAAAAPIVGLDRVPDLAAHLFPFQRECAEFALRVGRAGVFLDTGLGKTEIQLEWCHQALQNHGGRALILTPLAVARQTVARAHRWGYEARSIREANDIGPGINVVNYDRIGKIDPSAFDVVALDEASILKNFTGKTTRALIEAFSGTRFRLVATATPAPNDHMELGQYCEFLGVMPSNEMLMRWFIADQTQMGRYRLKGHAWRSFWDWMVSWSRLGEKPSDITGNLGDDAGFALPPFKVIRHRARDSRVDGDLADMFGAVTMSATSMHEVKRKTSDARAEKIGEIVAAEPAETRIIWVDTDYEADAVKRHLPDAAEVRGSMTIDRKEDVLEAFAAGEVRHLIAKPSMCGFGLDWSHCARLAFVGRSYSYETWYQAIRRCWRFGQKREVIVDLIVAEGEADIGRVIDRKARDHAGMKDAMRAAMRRACGGAAKLKVVYDPTHKTEMPTWLKSIR